MIHAATGQFVGEIDQYPPIFSAIKKDGVALYELARRGADIQTTARKITIHSFEITAIELPVVSFKVVCSTGTYIRSLANDFGVALGCGAYLSSLRRTRIGEFNVDGAVTMEDFENSGKLKVES
jgi:tRNA pseudouridine55 synthase